MRSIVWAKMGLAPTSEVGVCGGDEGGGGGDAIVTRAAAWRARHTDGEGDATGGALLGRLQGSARRPEVTRGRVGAATAKAMSGRGGAKAMVGPAMIQSAGRWTRWNGLCARGSVPVRNELDPQPS